jgi:hypothetical protein
LLPEQAVLLLVLPPAWAVRGKGKNNNGRIDARKTIIKCCGKNKCINVAAKIRPVGHSFNVTSGKISSNTQLLSRVTSQFLLGMTTKPNAAALGPNIENTG